MFGGNNSSQNTPSGTPKSKIASIITQFDGSGQQNNTTTSSMSRKASAASSTTHTPVIKQNSTLAPTTTTTTTTTPRAATTPRIDENSTATTDMNTNDISALYEVIKEFNARLTDELDLKIGQKVQVISDDSEYNDGWYMGKNVETGNVGLYPKSFTRLVPSSSTGGTTPYSKPALLRSRSRRLNSPSSQNSPITPSSAHANQQYQQNQQYFPPAHVNDSSVASSTDTLGLNKNKPVTSTTNNTRQSSLHTNTIRDIDDALAELNTSNSTSESLAPSQVESWSPEQVSSYFASIGVDVESAGQFARHKITGAILLELELSHLKELDISSFGTRFEIFKAIEALKIESRNSSKNKNVLSTPVQGQSLMPPPSVNRGDNTAPLHGHQRTRSQSMDDLTDSNASPLNNQKTRRSQQQQDAHKRQSYTFKQSASALQSPAQSYQQPQQPPSSRSNNLSSSGSSSDSIQHRQQPFVSPRKAPDPPTDAQARLNSSYKFGSGSLTPNTNEISQQFSRLSTLPEKERQMSSISRPTSSIYHSRSGSIPLSTSPTRGHKASNSLAKDKHKRHSSVFSFISGGNSINAGNDPYKQSTSSSRRNSLVNLIGSPSKIQSSKKKQLDDYGTDVASTEVEDNDLTDLTPVDDKEVTPMKTKISSPLKDKISSPITSPYRRSVSAQIPKNEEAAVAQQNQKRATSEALRMKSLRNTSGFSRSKTKTSAFKEGIQQVSPDDAIKTADHYGWMYKKGSLNFKKRYFTLHGTRLSYFQSLKDNNERGLIDIQAHRVLPADNNDLKSILASSTSAGRYSFKLLPPAPGSRKGLTFTQPKIHYFSVTTKEEMRSWMAALMKATIDMDETVPVVSSYTSATISLKQAQALQQKSSERAMKFGNKPPVAGTNADDTVSSSDTNTTFETPRMQQQSRLSSLRINENSELDDYSNTLATSTGADEDIDNGGFDSPYLLASGLLSPKSPTSNHSDELSANTAAAANNSSNSGGIHRTKTFGTNPVPMITNLENGTTSNSSAAAIAAANAANGALNKKK